MESDEVSTLLQQSHHNGRSRVRGERAPLQEPPPQRAQAGPQSINLALKQRPQIFRLNKNNMTVLWEGTSLRNS